MFFPSQKLSFVSASIGIQFLSFSTRKDGNSYNFSIKLRLQYQLAIIKLMAFVFRNDRKQSQQIKNPNVGPGAYNFQVQHENKIPKAYVPFGSMEPKGRSVSHNATGLIGPGSYNIEMQKTGEKIIVSSETQDIKILEISRPHPVFKSGANRFAQIKEEEITPGPGYKFKGIEPPRAKMMSTNTTQKPKILEHLININQYQSIPSIPSKVHAFGYNQNDKTQLELNEPPIECFKGDQVDSVGPGQYNPNNGVVKSKVASWSQSKGKRLDQNKNNVNVGPGAYEINNVNPLYNYKPSSTFASKTMRPTATDQKKGAMAVKPAVKIQDDQYSNQAQSRMLSEKAPLSTNIDSDEDSEYEYYEDTTPGPGSYMEISDVRKFKAGKTTTSFGQSTRFDKKANKKKEDNETVGPGAYNVGFQFGRKVKQPRKKPVVKEENRCPSIYNQNVAIPGPGSYEPRNTMEDKLIYKIQRGYRGQFGSTETRSKDQEEDEKPGPASYNPRQVPQEKQVSSAFRSKIQRKFIDEKKVVPPIGSYNMIYSDIATKIIKEEEEDPDLIIKKPGFGVGETRFKEQQKLQQDFEDDDIIKEIQQKHREQRRIKNLKNNSVFKSKDPRFRDRGPVNPGPGSYYDGEEDYWNKRTYNILFADI